MNKVSATKLERIVDKTILDELSPFGFVRDETGGSFSDRSNVYLYVAGLTQRLAGKNQIRPFGQIGFASVNEIKLAFMEAETPIQNRKRTGTFQVDYRHFAGERDAYIGCENEEELPSALERVREVVLKRMLPVLEQHTNPRRVLDVYLAHDERSKNSLGLMGAHNYSGALSGLILARLYSREHYDALKRRYAFFFEPLIPKTKERALKLVSYLDQDILPELPA